jgi:hypothetical protein
VIRLLTLQSWVINHNELHAKPQNKIESKYTGFKGDPSSGQAHLKSLASHDVTSYVFLVTMFSQSSQTSSV